MHIYTTVLKIADVLRLKVPRMMMVMSTRGLRRYMCAFHCTGKDTYTLDESCADVCRAVLALALAAIANAGGVCGAEACRSVAAA